MIDDAPLRAWLRERSRTDRATLALSTWEALRARVPDLPLPVVSLESADGATSLSWIVRDVVVEIDAYPDGSFGWFTRDRAADVHDGSEENVRVLPPEAWSALRRLVEPRETP